MLDNKKIFSISDVSNISGFSAHTLRFYEKIGLMPFVKRSASGKRIYDEYDVQILKSISVFKKTGMTNKQIKDLGSLYLEGNKNCLLYTSPSPRDGLLSRMPSSG